MDNFVCKYCNHTFKSSKSLWNHLNTLVPKYCALIKIERTCKSCNKIIVYKIDLQEHKSRCDPTTYYQHIKKQFDDENYKLKAEISELKYDHKRILDETIQNLQHNHQIEVTYLKQLIKTLENKLDKVLDKLKEPSITNNNITNNTNSNNRSQIINNLTVLNLNEDVLLEKIDKHFSIPYFNEGSKGVARFAVDYVIRDANGNLTYVPTDVSRNVFKYKADNGEIKRDIEALNLFQAIKPPIMDKIKKEIFSENVLDRNITGEMSDEDASFITTKFMEIKGLKQNVFASDLVKIINT